MFVASIAGLPAMPVTRASASATLSPGTATTRTSVSVPSPPSRPNVVTVCPAAVHNAARPPPTLPRPRMVIFTRDPSYGAAASARVGGASDLVRTAVHVEVHPDDVAALFR